MEQTTISMREIQRNYRQILERARKERRAMFLGAHGRQEAVLMDIDTFRALDAERQKKFALQRWSEVEKDLDRIASRGKKNVSLADFIHGDRSAH